MRVTCTNCGGAHTPWDCKRPAKKSTGEDLSSVVARKKAKGKLDLLPVDTNPDSLGKTATARRDGRPEGKEVSDGLGLAPDNPSVISVKRPRGRPKSITDMAAYKRAKQREYRAKWKGRE